VDRCTISRHKPRVNIRFFACFIGPGSVVRGKVAENTLVFGNPAREMGRASLYLERLPLAPDTLDTYGLPLADRRALQRAHFGLHDGGVR
jgi:hypothetical protein